MRLLSVVLSAEKGVRTPGIEPGTIRYLPALQSNALPTELCSGASNFDRRTAVAPRRRVGRKRLRRGGLEADIVSEGLNRLGSTRQGRILLALSVFPARGGFGVAQSFGPLFYLRRYSAREAAWPSGLRRQLQALVRKGVSSNLTAVNFRTPLELSS